LKICGFDIGHIVYCEVCHFGLGFCVGVLVYWLTQTILLRIISHNCPTTSGSLHRSCNSGFQLGASDHFIRNFSLSLALSSAVFVHILQDYTLCLF